MITVNQHLEELIRDYNSHVMAVLQAYGYNKPPTTEMLLRAYEIHGEDFIKDIYGITDDQLSNYGRTMRGVSDYDKGISSLVYRTRFASLENFINPAINPKSIAELQISGKQQGYPDNFPDQDINEKKSFFERAKGLWDKALPYANKSNTLLNLLDNQLINPDTLEDETPPDVTPKSENNKKIILYVIGGIVVVGLAIGAYFLFKNKS